MMRGVVGVALGATLGAHAARAQSSATISGRVVHKTSSAGVVGADVLLSPGQRQTVSDAAGHFQFDRVAPGNVALIVKRLGFAPESVSFALESPAEVAAIEVYVGAARIPIEYNSSSSACGVLLVWTK